jgi:VWFA-related protein
MKASPSVTGRAFRGFSALLVLGVVAGAAVLAAQGPVFRRTVELIAVDVQVLDNEGNPVGPIGPEAFDVSIDGKRRKVQSAQFVRHAENSYRGASLNAPTPAMPREDRLSQAAARTVILVVDSGSFTPGNIQAPMEAARSFLSGLGPDDRVGLYVFPTVMWVPPTTQRAPIGTRLANLVGEKEPLRSYYNLAPHEIVDITAQSTNPNSFLLLSRTGAVGEREAARALDPVLRIQARECPGNTDQDCAIKIWAEGMSLATQLEREAKMSLGGIEQALRLLAEMPGRKSVVFITGGLLVSDRLDGQPDPGTFALGMGQAAARANATIYTVHIDSTVNATGLASKKGIGEVNLSRDRALMGNWLDNFSRSAGGRRIDVPLGGGGFAFDRVLKETSAYYLLGVEPADADRDGKPHALKVKVGSRGANVRNRQWVVVPPPRPQPASIRSSR